MERFRLRSRTRATTTSDGKRYISPEFHITTFTLVSTIRVVFYLFLELCRQAAAQTRSVIHTVTGALDIGHRTLEKTNWKLLSSGYSLVRKRDAEREGLKKNTPFLPALLLFVFVCERVCVCAQKL